MKKIIKKFIAIFLLIPNLILSIGCGKNEFMLFEDYSDYVSNLYQYSADINLPENGNNNDNQEQEYQNILVESVDELSPVDNYMFDFGTPFFGKYAYVVRNNIPYLLDFDGNMHLLRALNRR